MKKLILILLLSITFLIRNISAYQVCNTDIQITFKNGINIVTGITEGFKIYK